MGFEAVETASAAEDEEELEDELAELEDADELDPLAEDELELEDSAD